MKILHVIHDFLPRHRAGSEVYAFHLAKEQQRRHSVQVLCAEYEPSSPHAGLRTRVHEGLLVTEVVNNWRFADFEETYRSPTLESALSRALDETSPELLHIHNLLNLSMNLPALAWARGIPSVATLHDYTLVCPSGGQRVHVAEEHVCARIDPERCARCFPQSPFHAQMQFSRLGGSPLGGKLAGALARAVRVRAPAAFGFAERAASFLPAQGLTSQAIRARLEHVKDVFQQVSLFVAPSRALGDAYLELGLPPQKLRVSDYGFRPLSPPPAAARPAPDGRLRIGFVGTLIWHKGVHVLLEAVRGLPKERYVLHVHGALETFPAYARTLRRSALGLPVEFHGAFDEARVAEVYAGLDVLVVPSLWPENSPLVIHEAFMAGVPVVGSRQGGIPELLDDGKQGMLFAAGSAWELRKRLQTLLDEPETLARLRARLPAVKSIAEDAAEWDERYREALAQLPSRAG